MQSIWETPFIVVDVETSGFSPVLHRIIEIACITVIGGEVVSKFSSLVNPHQFIPPFIANMTGITNEIAFTAPEIEEIFPEVSRIFSRQDAVFAAHPVKFDWGFVSSFFTAAGSEPPKISKLCTLKLARRLLPKNQKKNVGALAQFFNIEIKDRHRAYDDALATAYVLIELLDKAANEHNISTLDELLLFQNKPIRNFKPATATFNRIKARLNELPSEPGVYNFLDKNGDLLYIGKAKSLKDRVRSYFYDETTTSKKISDMVKKIYDIRWECTGTELSALLLESRKIKGHKPPFNTADKKYRSYPFIKITNEEFPKLEMANSVDDDGAEYYGPFQTPTLVEEILLTMEKQFKIRKCEKPFNPHPDNRACFYFHIKRCDAPCNLGITSEEYKKELERVRYFLSGFSDGIIKQLESKMEHFAEILDFEKAQTLKFQIQQLKKLFERKYSVAMSINSNNLIFIHLASSEKKTIELFFIKRGKLHFQSLIEQFSDMSETNKQIHFVFFNGVEENLTVSIEDANEIRIITSWTYRKQNQGIFLYTDGKTEADVCLELKEIINSIEFEPIIADEFSVEIA